MTDIDQALRQLACEVHYPPTPPIAIEVTQRLEQCVGASTQPVRHRRTLAGWSRRPRIAVAAGVAALLTAAAPILFLGGSGEVAPAAAAVLRKVAAVAAVQEAEGPPGPGQYFFTRSREAYLEISPPGVVPGPNPACKTHACEPPEAAPGWSVFLPEERETWTAPDGTMRLRVISKTPEFLSEAQRAKWRAAGSPPLGSGHVSDELIKGAKFLDTSELPTDPEALRKMIEARTAPQFVDPPGEAETFVLIGDLLRETYLPPAFRAALYKVAAELPGVELLGEVEDPAGRRGTGIAYTDDETRHELIFDPNTSALLGEREVVVDPRSAKQLGLPPGTEIGSAAYLESGVVDSIRKPAAAGAAATAPSRQSVESGIDRAAGS